MKRSRRRTLALAASFAVHLLAFLVLTPVAVPRLRLRLAGLEPPAMQVELLRLRDGLGRLTPEAPDQPSPLAPSAAASPDLTPPPPDAVPPDEAETSVVAQDAPLDIDPLFRVPFRDAVAQAEAALRAGLSCAHVDLQQLPQTLIDLCAAADRRAKAAKPATPQPAGPSPGDDRA